MSERNQRKNRQCKLCGMGMLGKASRLKEHGKECKKIHQDAAAKAIMEKMVEDMADGQVLASGG